MTITLADIDFLTSDAGQRLLAELAKEDLSEERGLQLLTTLRRSYSAQQAGAALEMARLRLKAVEKFGTDAARMLFTREALEQASDPLVRAYCSRSAQDKQVVDACCGMGADSLAMAQAGGNVLGLDVDPVRVAIARHNADALGLATRFEVADVRDGLPPADLAFYDPARRDEQGRRIFDVEAYQPPLSLITMWHQPQVVVKLSPGVDLEQVPRYGGAVEFISVHGDLKEAVLWLGFGEAGLKATLLTGAEAFHWQPGDTPAVVTLSPPRRWLVEPDPALLRAGLVADVAAAFDGSMLDETIAYFTTDKQAQSPWLRSWEILDWMPFQLKRLRAHLRVHGVGRVTVKKRGSPLTPEALIPQLKLKGSASRTLVLTRHAGQPIVIVCADIAV